MPAPTQHQHRQTLLVSGRRFVADGRGGWRYNKINVKWSDFGECFVATAPGCSAKGGSIGEALELLRKRATNALEYLK